MVIIWTSVVIAIIVSIICLIKFKKLDNSLGVFDVLASIGLGASAFWVIGLILVGCTSSFAPVSEIKDYPIYNQGASAYYLNDKNEIVLLNDDKNGYKIEVSDQVSEPVVQIIKYDWSVFFRGETISVVLPTNDYKE